jgi:hypothetical protein
LSQAAAALREVLGESAGPGFSLDGPAALSSEQETNTYAKQ